jgi:hypothetical protein
MQDFEIPITIWLNLVLLVAAAGFVWIRLAARSPWKLARKKDRLIGRVGPA